MSANASSARQLIFEPSEWRALLHDELLAAGLGHDAAGLVARRVIERLVRGYLGGRLDPSSSPAGQFDEAA
ncbi:MAG TPA: hypothetical protein VFL27_13985 [Candidatus Dormibacteraeota bacterium]|nr:hypothetical protein [Candidatus Dormibacteraeota bacterium]